MNGGLTITNKNTMINYPKNHNTCGQTSTNIEPDRKDIQANIGVARTIARLGQSLALLDNAHTDQSERIGRMQIGYNELSFKLSSAEEQEEICGLIARGEFSKLDEATRDGRVYSGLEYHPYTDSQKAVKLLLEANAAHYAQFQTYKTVSEQLKADVEMWKKNHDAESEGHKETSAKLAALEVKFHIAMGDIRSLRSKLGATKRKGAK